ncbi:Uncharacterised protein [Candidatus Norongarragalina meridionalis]|nr:Uncharacterised protein [Candidatus Norongarragalina meridionalis]
MSAFINSSYSLVFLSPSTSQSKSSARGSPNACASSATRSAFRPAASTMGAVTPAARSAASSRFPSTSIAVESKAWKTLPISCFLRRGSILQLFAAFPRNAACAAKCAARLLFPSSKPLLAAFPKECSQQGLRGSSGARRRFLSAANNKLPPLLLQVLLLRYQVV